ncbi:MAG: FAD-dependent oxidoreductase [Candidatus Manganitrophus sp.]|nr:MAG: FAD-dependent oxidoreductase [Candidatus Manganitrophus sp.]
MTVFEKDDRIGGLLRYGIPDFKMEKSVLDRRLEQMAAEGVIFQASVEVGKDLPVDQLRREFDAVLLTGGAMQPRDLPVPGRELAGIHFAMDFLTQQNKLNAGDAIDRRNGFISAKGKQVVIIGGGDTGSDCLGTAHRQGAEEIYQFELLPEPPPIARRPPPGPFGRCSFALRMPTRKGANGNGPFPPKPSSGRTGGSRSSRRFMSS